MDLFYVTLVLACQILASPILASPVQKSQLMSILADYHETIGVPEAARIKAFEDAIDFDGSRIAGGQSSSLGQFPYMAGLLIALADGRTSVCGASLVSNTRLVTAAHCWTDGRNTAVSIEVVLGSLTLFTGGTRVRTSDVEAHQNYNSAQLHNDIAMIRVPAVSLNNNIQPIEIPSGFLLWLTFEGNVAQAAGFGRTGDLPSQDITTSQTLRHVSLRVMPNLECASLYGFGIIDSIVCTYGLGRVGICGGDSGGPLALTLSGVPTLIGVSSFSSGLGCTADFPSGYTRVTSLASWINARL